ncbi:MAG: hypothetical protein WC053_04900 [Sideroxydans sp.]
MRRSALLAVALLLVLTTSPAQASSCAPGEAVAGREKITHYRFSACNEGLTRAASFQYSSGYRLNFSSLLALEPAEC